MDGRDLPTACFARALRASSHCASAQHPAIVEELTEVVSRPKLRVVAAHPDLSAVLSWLCDAARLVIPGVTLDVVREDPDDNRAIECAVGSGAEAVVFIPSAVYCRNTCG